MNYLYLILLLICPFSYGQTFEVLSVEKAYTSDKERIEVGQTLDLNDVIVVKKGELRFSLKNRWVFVKKTGTYSIDSIYKTYKVKHFKHDSICSILEVKELINCDFNYHYNCIHSGHDRDPDHIKFNTERIDTNATSIPISWEHPIEEYNGEYFVLVMDFGEEYLELHQTSKKQLNLDISKYVLKNKLFLVRVISIECRESQKLPIIFKE